MLILGLRKLYATYLKEHANGSVYVGRTSGWVKVFNFFSAQKIVKRRDSKHHRNKDGFGPAVLDKFSANKDEIYGREQLIYEQLMAQGRCGNKIRPVGNKNKNKMRYLLAAAAAFGDILITLAAIHYWIYPIF